MQCPTRSLVRLAALMMLYVLAQLPARANDGLAIQWNGYEWVERFESTFESIADSPTQSAVIDDHNGYFSLLIPTTFSFRLLGALHSGCTLRLSVNGVATFLNAPPASTPLGTYDLSWYTSGTPWRTELLMPFWGNFEPASGGAIFAEIRDLPSTDPMGSKVLIVEWHVYEQGTLGPIVFQMRLYEGTNIIEYLYDSKTYDSPLTTDADPKCGAAVGIKKFGQNGPCGTAQPPDELSLIIGNQTGSLDAHIGQPIHCVAGTIGCGTCGSSGSNWAELISTMPSGGRSPSFHYALPTVGYRIKPVIVDVGGDTNGTGSRICNIFSRGEKAHVNGTFMNYGTDTVRNMQVQAQLISFKSDISTILDSAKAVVPVLPPGRRTTVAITSAGGFDLSDTASGARYAIRYWCNQPNDWNRHNDTVYYPINVGKHHDAMTCCINSPRLNVAGAPHVYPINKPIPINVGFYNAGSAALTGVPNSVVIVGPGNAIAYTQTGAPIDMDPGTEQAVQFAEFTPTAPGLYYVRARTALTSDDNPTNDLLNSYPYATAAHSTLAPPAAVPFRVAYAMDLALGWDGPIHPDRRITLRARTRLPIAAVLTNSGAVALPNVAVRARLVNRKTKRAVYDKTIVVANIEAGARRTISFGTVLPGSHGDYVLTISMTPKGDATPRDNNLAAVVSVQGIMTSSPTSGTIQHPNIVAPARRAKRQ